MFRKPSQKDTLPAVDAAKPLPEFRKPQDPVAEEGRRLRDRYDALRPRNDLKHWR